MKWTAVALALSTAALLVSPVALRAQTRSPRGLYATVFRSPSTGFELRRGALAVNAGFYPTILTADGQTTSAPANIAAMRRSSASSIRQLVFTTRPPFGTCRRAVRP